MKVSARNTISGTVKQIIPGAINTEVTVEVAPGIEMTGIITKTSAENLELSIGQKAYVLVKSSDVMIAVD
ncbi:MAG: molybdopterin-binding protein [Scytonematopsis contorta HA4267-MV1]|jgi:molybdopterin-binding protein|nr:molybdopterin-binding protein [Scytonematopsis contorta HA4267-MV1]